MNSKLLPLALALFVLPAVAQQKPAYTDAEAAQHVGEEATVTGKVVNISSSGKGTTFLNFGNRYPNETFGAVIFASKVGAIGDVKQFEGKEVSVTGKIEMSPSQKPQIVINGPDQIKLAGAAGPSPLMPNTASAATTTPATAPATATPPAPKRTGKIQLASGWNSPRRDGEMARKDLAKLFGHLVFPAETAEVDTSIEVYPGIPLLTPLAAAKKTLNIESVSHKKSRVATAGMPQNSFSAYEVNGVFPGGFNRLSLITDADDQVISVLLVDTSTRTQVNNETDTNAYHTYDFIAGSGKGASYFVIKHDVTKPAVQGGTLVVDTLLVDPSETQGLSDRKSSSKSSGSSSSSKGKTGKVLERSRWYVPSSVAGLILRCVGG